MINDLTSRGVWSRWVGGKVVGGRFIGGSVRRFNKTLEKNMFGIVISAVPFGRGLFCYSDISLYILTINKKQIWSPEAITRIFNYS